MLQSLDDQYEAECDNCSQEETGLGEQFMEATRELKSRGWRIYYHPVEKEYYHACCKECYDELKNVRS